MFPVRDGGVSYYQLQIDYYRYKLLYVSLKVTRKQKSIVNTQKIKRTKYKHTASEIHKTIRRTTEKEGNRERNYKNRHKYN